MSGKELSGASIVLNGSFNHAALNPSWLAEQNLLSGEAAEYANSPENPRPLTIVPQLTAFTTDWLTAQITPQQTVIFTDDEAREVELRDFGVGLLSLLPETPIDAMGINFNAHFRIETEVQWHLIGDRFLPKQPWEAVLPDGNWQVRSEGFRIGLRTVTVEATRGESKIPCIVRMEVAPSVIIVPLGLYCAINCHFEPTEEPGKRGNALEFCRILEDEWPQAKSLSYKMMESVRGVE
jgi:hypothetical protein